MRKIIRVRLEISGEEEKLIGTIEDMSEGFLRIKLDDAEGVDKLEESIKLDSLA